MKWDYPSPTMTGGCVMISKGRFGHPEQNRAISLREAARLQTFPDSFKFVGNFGEIAKQIGNAVPPLLAKRAADVLLRSMKDLETTKRLIPTYGQGYVRAQEVI
jgi:DNA (cytosine-5)-methyltransferase 1